MLWELTFFPRVTFIKTSPLTTNMKYLSIQEAMKKGKGNVAIRGWVHRERGSNKLKFIVLRDSTNIIQCVLKKDNLENQWENIDHLQVEASLELEGEIKVDERAPTGYELQVNKLNIVGTSDNYPIGKDQNPEFLLDNRHLWLRSRKMIASMKIRSTLLLAFHEFMHKKGFIEIHAPSMSSATSEGGSDTFEVKYFDQKAYLTQSWQFYAENFINAVEKAYAIAPSFRAEKSRTPWHVTEFWHFEVEAAWIDLQEDMILAEECVEYAVQKVLKENLVELEIVEADLDKLKKVKAPFKRVTYSEAIETLQKNNHKIKQGDDFKSSEERSLAKYYDNNFVFVTNYPLALLKFYHGEDPELPGTGTNFNLLAPGIGEMVDGSQREPDLNKIIERLKKAKMDLGASDWYLDSRRYGSVPHAGFGLGIERFAAWICGFDTIKDCIPFPRTPTRLNP